MSSGIMAERQAVEGGWTSELPSLVVRTRRMGHVATDEAWSTGALECRRGESLRCEGEARVEAKGTAHLSFDVSEDSINRKDFHD